MPPCFSTSFFGLVVFDDFNTFLSPTEIRNDILNWSVSRSFLINNGSICVLHSRVSMEKQEKVRNDLTRQRSHQRTLCWASCHVWTQWPSAWFPPSSKRSKERRKVWKTTGTGVRMGRTGRAELNICFFFWCIKVYPFTSWLNLCKFDPFLTSMNILNTKTSKDNFEKVESSSPNFFVYIITMESILPENEKEQPTGKHLNSKCKISTLPILKWHVHTHANEPWNFSLKLCSGGKINS